MKGSRQSLAGFAASRVIGEVEKRGRGLPSVSPQWECKTLPIGWASLASHVTSACKRKELPRFRGRSKRINASFRKGSLVAAVPSSQHFGESDASSVSCTKDTYYCCQVVPYWVSTVLRIFLILAAFYCSLPTFGLASRCEWINWIRGWLQVLSVCNTRKNVHF